MTTSKCPLQTQGKPLPLILQQKMGACAVAAILDEAYAHFLICSMAAAGCSRASPSWTSSSPRAPTATSKPSVWATTCPSFCGLKGRYKLTGDYK